MRKATRITFDPSPEARKVLEKLAVRWHLNLRQVLEALVRREGGMPPFEKREEVDEDLRFAGEAATEATPAAREALDNVVMAVMMDDGPDGHTDGSREIVEAVIRTLARWHRTGELPKDPAWKLTRKYAPPPPPPLPDLVVAPAPALRDPFAPTVPGWVQALAANAQAGGILDQSGMNALRRWMEGKDLAGHIEAPVPPPAPAPPRLQPPPEPPTPAPEPPIGPPTRAWDDPDAPQWVRAIGQTLELGDVVPEERVLLFRRWRAGEDVEP